MRQAPFLWFVLLLATPWMGCTPTGKIQVSYDTIRDLTVADLKTTYESQEIRACEGCEDPYAIDVWYVREFDGGEPRPVEMTLWLEDRELDGVAFGEQGFIRIGMQPFRLGVEDLSGEERAQIGKRKGQGAGGVMTFTPELEVAILKANKLTMRLFAGQQPLTIELSGEALNLLRKFIETVPLHKSQRM